MLTHAVCTHVCIPHAHACKQMVSALIPTRLCKRTSLSACSLHPQMASCSHGPRIPWQALGVIPLHIACPCPAQHHCPAHHNQHPSLSSRNWAIMDGERAPHTSQCWTRAAPSRDPPASLPITGMLCASWRLPSPLHHPHPSSSPWLASTMPWHAHGQRVVQLPSPAHTQASPHSKAPCPQLHPEGLFLWSL